MPIKQKVQAIPTINGKIGTPQVHIASAKAVQNQISGLLAKRGPVTQTFGQQSQYDVFSKGKSPAYEVAIPSGTALATPPGQWKVVSAFNGSTKPGYIGNFEGQGWGNHVRLQNTQTGEVIGFNHMTNVNVKPGDTIGAGQIVGTSGSTGNATGAHVALTYYDKSGRASDFAKSPYFQYLYQGVNRQPMSSEIASASTGQDSASPMPLNGASFSNQDGSLARRTSILPIPQVDLDFSLPQTDYSVDKENKKSKKYTHSMYQPWEQVT